MGIHNLTITASNAAGTATTGYVITKQPGAPSEFKYNPNAVTTYYGETDNSVTPNINWNGATGTFHLESGVNENIHIESHSGKLSWNVGLPLGTHHFIVTASNTTGTTTATFTIKKVPNIPTNFSYTPNVVTLGLGTASSTVMPQVNWNGATGTFRLVNQANNTIGINTKTGQISWTSALASGTHVLTAVASNVTGTDTTTFTIIVVPPSKPSNFNYQPPTVTSSLGTAGSTAPPAIHWNFDPGNFSIPNNTNNAIVMNTKNGILSWNSSLKIGQYPIVVHATNKYGTVSTTFTLNRIKAEEYFPPTDFSYTPNRVSANNLEAGQSAKPKIQWYGYPGSFKLETTPASQIKIDPKNGIVHWEKGLASGTYNLVVIASNFVGSVSTSLLISSTFIPVIAPPSEFQYLPNQAETIFGTAGNSTVPQVKWNNETGSFALLNPNVQGIEINTASGALAWNEKVPEGTYDLQISASNSAGNATTSYTLIVNPEPDKTETPEVPLPPQDFVYTPSAFNILQDSPGQSAAPNINWNGNTGTFAFSNATTEAIQIHTETGVISWDSALAPGTYSLTVQATNPYGSIQTQVVLIKALPPAPQPPADLRYPNAVHITMANESGQSGQPEINWNNENGTFAFVQNPPKGFTINSQNGVIRWDNTIAPGNYKLTVIATNKAGQTSTTWTLKVTGPNEKNRNSFNLYRNYPNPAEEYTYFAYRLKKAGNVTIRILTINGKSIQKIMDKKPHQPGFHSFKANMMNRHNGLYIIQLTSDTEGVKSMAFLVYRR